VVIKYFDHHLEVVINNLITTFFTQLTSNPSLKCIPDPTPPDEKTPPVFLKIMGGNNI